MPPVPPAPLPEPFGTPEALLAALAESLGGFVSFIGPDERVRFATHGFAAWYGTTPPHIVGRSLVDLYGPAAYAEFAPWVRRALAGEPVQYERQAVRPGGGAHWISVSLRPHRDAEGRVAGVFSCSLEVKELKRTHDALQRALAELASHIENTPLAVVEWSSNMEVARWSPQAEAIFGWKAEEVLEKRPEAFGLVHPESRELVAAITRELVEGRERRNRMLTRNLTKDGRAIHCEWYNSALFDAKGRFVSLLSLAQDVTARFEAEEQLLRQAVLDALTGLPNRNSLAARLEHAIVRVNRSGDRVALVFIDLDRFKRVNDSLGHAAGDEILRQAAARIRACVREVDTVARVGGDEFVVLLETDVREDTPGIIGERLRAAFATPFQWKGVDVHCGASMGVSFYPDHARDPEALLASADEAMYRAKQST